VITTEKKIAKFAPVGSNPYGYEIRTVQFINGKLKVQAIEIIKNSPDLPVLKPKKDCVSGEYKKQAMSLFEKNNLTLF